MVDPVTVVIAIGVAITTLISAYSVGKELYKERFKNHIIDSYDIESSEYIILWSIMTYSQHVNDSKVKKRDSRRILEESPLVRTISCIAEFKQKTDLSPQKSYIFRLLHDVDNGRPCIVMLCPNNDMAVYFNKLLFIDGIVPSNLILVGSSK